MLRTMTQGNTTTYNDYGSKPINVANGDNGTNLEYRVYPSRWWILFIFSMTSMLQSLVWITYGPVQDVSIELYGWDAATVNLLAAWGPIMYIPFAFITTWTFDRYGVRKSVLFGSGLVCVGACVRIITTHRPYAVILIHLGQILNASAGPLVMGGPSRISSDWFAPNERASATAVAAIANNLGAGAGFLVALPVTSTLDLQYLQYAEAGAATLVFIATIIYFPERPPTPPSGSAGEQSRVQITSVKETTRVFVRIISRKQVWLLAIAYGMTSGVFNGFTAVLAGVLDPLGYNQTDAAWLGFVITMAGVLGGLLFGFLADVLHHLKALILAGFVLASLGFTLFALITTRVIPTHSTALVYAGSVLGGLAVTAVVPLFYELGAETTHPAPADKSALFFTLWNNIGALIFLVAGTKLSSEVLVWAMTSVCVLFAVVLSFYKRDDRRSKVDGLTVDGVEVGATETTPLV